jgi:transcriptional regulator GlxA family with amidase domain
MGARGLRRVAVLAYPQVDVVDVAGPCEVFAGARPALRAAGVAEDAGYAVDVLSSTRDLTIETDSGVRLLAHRSYAGHRDTIDTLQAWLAEHLDEDLSVERLAARTHMSPRNFARVFRRQLGCTPARFVEQMRVEAACRRLEESEAGLAQIACECGFGSAHSLRRSFLRELRVALSDYRSRFHAGPTLPFRRPRALASTR